MELTLGNNPAITQEVANGALQKCLEFFKRLSFSTDNTTTDDFKQRQINLHKALIKGNGELYFWADKMRPFNNQISIQFGVSVDGKPCEIFCPYFSDLQETAYLQLSELLTDEEIGSLFLFGGKNEINRIKNALIGQIGDLTLNAPSPSGKMSLGDYTSGLLDFAEMDLREIEGYTSDRVRFLLLNSNG